MRFAPSNRRLVCSFLFLCVLGFASSRSAAQSTDDFAALKQQAVELYKEGKLEDALPIYEKLHAAEPDDLVVLEGLAFCTLTHAQTLTDSNARKAERIKA